MSPDKSSEEARRLRALQFYRVLDTASEKAFDDLTRLAATICDAPVSLISFVDADRQWFKSRQGLAAEQTPREHAFCAHTITGPEFLIVGDASQDERFAENPLVLGDPHIRFYAGAPLEVDSGVRLGSLCVIDRKPRQLADHQLEALGIVRDSVVAQLKLRRAQTDLLALQKMLPMCAWCRSVRVGDEGQESWQPLDEYVLHSVEVTHGMCPSCSLDLLGQVPPGGADGGT